QAETLRSNAPRRHRVGGERDLARDPQLTDAPVSPSRHAALFTSARRSVESQVRGTGRVAALLNSDTCLRNRGTAPCAGKANDRARIWKTGGGWARAGWRSAGEPHC